ncbi:MAG: hypothetical protein MZW92_29320 [Comamonadaceae bacterium]|nr:hypothetical protein [Comamonadaceae bacterium]
MNEAYRTLKQPAEPRAATCWSCTASTRGTRRNTAMPAEFLMEQMEWREAADGGARAPRIEPALEQLHHRLRCRGRSRSSQRSRRISIARTNYAAAADAVCVRTDVRPSTLNATSDATKPLRTSLETLMALLQIAEPGQSAAPHQHRLAVGIDLGTTNSLVATVRNGVPSRPQRRAGAGAAALRGALPCRQASWSLCPSYQVNLSNT